MLHCSFYLVHLTCPVYYEILNKCWEIEYLLYSGLANMKAGSWSLAGVWESCFSCFLFVIFIWFFFFGHISPIGTYISSNYIIFSPAVTPHTPLKNSLKSMWMKKITEGVWVGILNKLVIVLYYEPKITLCFICWHCYSFPEISLKNHL